MPRGLIVGNKDLGNDIFLGLYDGFIAPVGFEESKKKITNANLSKAGDSISDSISNLNLSDKEKLIYGIGALLLIGGIIYKTKKFSIPVLLGLTVVGSSLLTNTTYVEQPNYYNRLSFGDIEIYIPKEEDDYLPKES